VVFASSASSRAVPAAHSARAPRAVSPGCSAAFPSREGISGFLQFEVAVCFGPHGASVKNYSSHLVLQAWITRTSMRFHPKWVWPQDRGPAERTIEAAVRPDRCVGESGAYCRIDPEFTVEMSGPSAPFVVHVEVLPELTSEAVGAGAAADYVAKRVNPTRHLLNEAAECGQDVSDYYSSQDTDDSIRNALEAGSSCHSVYKDVAEDLGDEEDDSNESGAALELKDDFTAALHTNYSKIAILLEHIHD
jgi:hypothetical protein